jgi:non-ribosomal peptide synthase protein (TIGR01720 family)
MYPFMLEVPGDDIGPQIKFVKEALRKIPHKGLDFGILRYAAPTAEKTEGALTLWPQVSFNYLGQFDDPGAKENNSIFTFAEESSGQAISPGLARHHMLDISGLIIRGQLHLSIIFHPEWNRQETIETLLANCQKELLLIVDHCSRKKEREHTPSDFTYSELAPEDYNRILEQLQ